MTANRRKLILQSSLAIALASCGVMLAARSESQTDAGTTSAKGIEAATLLKTTQSWNGNALPKYPDGTPEVTILELRIEPHARLDMHKHPVINAALVLHGDLKVTTDANETRTFHAGDAFAEVVDTWHYGTNDGSEPVDLVVFYAGVQGTPITVRKEP